MTNDQRVRISLLGRIRTVEVFRKCSIYSRTISSNRLWDQIENQWRTDWEIMEHLHNCQCSNIRWAPVVSDCLRWVPHPLPGVLLMAGTCWLSGQFLELATISMWSFCWWAIAFLGSVCRSLSPDADPIRLEFGLGRLSCTVRVERVWHDAVRNVHFVDICVDLKIRVIRCITRIYLLPEAYPSQSKFQLLAAAPFFSASASTVVLCE